MNSDEARELFGEALEGTLGPEQKAALDAALADDPELRDEYEAYRMVVQGAAAIGAQSDEVAIPDLLIGVQTRLRRRSRGRFYRDPFAQQAGPKSALPILVAIVVALTLAATWVAVQNLIVIESQPPDAASTAGERSGS